jgi:hypothetical protein
MVILRTILLRKENRRRALDEIEGIDCTEGDALKELQPQAAANFCKRYKFCRVSIGQQT